jgi:hypothetical protein
LSQSLVRVGDYSSTWNVDLCRDSTEAGSNLLKLRVTDGFFWRSEIPIVTVIGPLSDPRPLPYRLLPTGEVAVTGGNLRWIEAAQARLALYAECVQCEGDDVVLADEHRHLDELALVEVCGEHRPGVIGNAGVGV